MGTPFQTGKHLPQIVSAGVILGVCITYILLRVCVCVCVSLEEKRGGLKGKGQGPGQHCGEPFKKKGLIREGIIEVYLHQLSARLLGWRRSCDPPAIVLELPAGNNQSHCYSRSRPHQLKSWPEDRNYSLQPLREVQRKNLKRKASKLETVIRERKGESLFYVELKCIAASPFFFCFVFLPSANAKA